MAKNGKIEIKEIPIMPQVASKILQLQEDNLQISFKELENIVLLDPALTTKILKVANSALYARQREITNLQQALTLLGFKMIKSLVLLVSASNIYGKSKRKIKADSDTLLSKSSEIAMWKHLLLTAFIARHIAEKLGNDEKQDDIFIAGLIHDIGRFALLLNDPNGYESYLDMIKNNPDMDVLSIEENKFGYNHAEVGKMVLKNWNFPDELIDVVHQHHSMHVDSPYKKTVEIVGIANLYSRIVIKEYLTPADLELKEAYIKILSISEEIDKYITEHFMDEIKNDELYIMSTTLV